MERIPSRSGPYVVVATRSGPERSAHEEKARDCERIFHNARDTLRRARMARLAAVPKVAEPVSRGPSGSAVDLVRGDPPRARARTASDSSPVPRWFSRCVTLAAGLVALSASGLLVAALADAPSRAHDPGSAPPIHALPGRPSQMAAPPRADTPSASEPMGATGWRSVHVLSRPAGALASLGGATCTTPCTLLVGGADAPRPLTLVRVGFDPFVEQVVVDTDLHVLVALGPGTRAPEARPEVP